MENSLEILEKTTLFSGIAPAQIRELLTHFRASVREVGRGELLVLEGEAQKRIGIVLQGTLEAGKDSAGGARITIAHMGPGSIYGDLLAGSRELKSPVSIQALTAARILLLPYESIVAPCGDCPAYSRFLQNLWDEIAEKFFVLHRRIDLLCIKSLRGKIAHYLLEQHRAHGETVLTLSLSRQQLAACLGCERRALSRERSRMQQDGLIERDTHRIRLCDVERLRQCL